MTKPAPTKPVDQYQEKVDEIARKHQLNEMNHMLQPMPVRQGKSVHINPNCRDSTLCNPHNEFDKNITYNQPQIRPCEKIEKLELFYETIPGGFTTYSCKDQIIINKINEIIERLNSL